MCLELSERDIKPVARVLQPERKEAALSRLPGSNPNWTVAYAAALIAANTTARGADLTGPPVGQTLTMFEGVMAIS